MKTRMLRSPRVPPGDEADRRVGTYESTFELPGRDWNPRVPFSRTWRSRCVTFRKKLEFSPARLEQIENRLAEISSLKRKYGGSIESALEHLARSEDRLRQVEHAGERETEVQAELAASLDAYVRARAPAAPGASARRKEI